jgi:3-oxoacyl-[acyl-carrier-protein] synthase II
MGAFTHFALAASDEAVKNSGLQIDESNADMVGTYISSGIGDFWAIEREHEKLLNSGPDRVSPFFIVSAIVNLASGNVSIRHGAKGPNSRRRRPAQQVLMRSAIVSVLSSAATQTQ